MSIVALESCIKLWLILTRLAPLQISSINHKMGECPAVTGSFTGQFIIYAIHRPAVCPFDKAH